MTAACTLSVGDRVRITAPADAAVHTTKWWPKTGPVTGTVQRLFKNGELAVAVDQIRNRSEDGLHTMHFPASWLSPEELTASVEAGRRGHTMTTITTTTLDYQGHELTVRRVEPDASHAERMTVDVDGLIGTANVEAEGPRVRFGALSPSTVSWSSAWAGGASAEEARAYAAALSYAAEQAPTLRAAVSQTAGSDAKPVLGTVRDRHGDHVAAHSADGGDPFDHGQFPLRARCAICWAAVGKLTPEAPWTHERTGIVPCAAVDYDATPDAAVSAR